MISKKIIEYSTACEIFNVIKNTKNKLNNLLKKAKSNGKRAGIYTLTPEYAKRMIQLGFDYVVISSDARMLTAQATKTLTELRSK